MEQIYKWNPDIIYLSTFTAYKPEDLYNNTAAANDDWSQVKAVKIRTYISSQLEYSIGIRRQQMHLWLFCGWQKIIIPICLKA